MPAIATIIIFIILLAVKSLFNFDLFPALIVFLAIKNKPEETIACAALAGFIEDALFYAGYIHFLSFSIIGGLAIFLKQFFSFEEDDLALVLVIILAPLSVIITALGMKLFQNAEFPSLIFMAVRSLIVNGLAVLAVNYFFWRRR